MGRRGVAGDGEGAGEAARRDVGTLAAGLRGRLSARRALLSVRVPALGLAAALLYRRPPRPARAVRARARAGVRRVARDAARDVVTPGPSNRGELETLPVSGRA